MNLLVVGDVHGCFHTFKKLVKKHWRPEEEILIQIGDLINKGPHSGKALKYWWKLEEKYPEKTVFIRGNHEQKYLEARRGESYFPNENALSREFKKAGLSPDAVCDWISKTPLKYKTDYFLITHGGVAEGVKNPYDAQNPRGVLYNKERLARKPKIQVKGHSIIEGNKPIFTPSENAWYIDTGAWTGKYLSGVRFSADGGMIEVVRREIAKKDWAKMALFK